MNNRKKVIRDLDAVQRQLRTNSGKHYIQRLKLYVREEVSKYTLKNLKYALDRPHDDMYNCYHAICEFSESDWRLTKQSINIILNTFYPAR